MRYGSGKGNARDNDAMADVSDAYAWECDDEMRMIMGTMGIVVHENNQELLENKANNMHNENGQDIRYARVTVRTVVIDTITNKRDSKPEEGKGRRPGNQQKATSDHER